jgi:hypothetical protein
MTGIMKRLNLPAILILFPALSFSQISFENNLLVMENELVRQSINFSGGCIKPGSVFSKVKNIELLNAESPGPWFEFVANNQVVSSGQPIWKIKDHSIRKMINGGEEIKVTVEAQKKVKGLIVDIYRQMFPNSALIRERIVLSANPGKTLTLNKLEGRLHFVFPRYNLRCVGNNDKITETRIATFDNEILENFNPDLTWDDRTRSLNLAHCHMFHPEITTREIATGSGFILKGPFAVYATPEYSWMMAYEHASQDKNYGSEFGNAWKRDMAGQGIDLQQGVEGASGIAEKEDDFWFLALAGEKKSESADIHVEILRGGYLEGEIVTAARPYESVWTASTFLFNESERETIMNRYLLEQISENPASRKSHFYYNTWGMQRDNNNKTGLREIFTESRILDEIRYAAELKVDLFVLDDGWEEMMGVWRPHPKRLPNGLSPLIGEMKKNNIIPGIWLSPMGVDSLSERYRQHPEWILRDYSGKPIKAQWGLPAFDFVSGFYDLFVSDCKRLIDEGIRFFKWDAINTFNSTLPDLDHGSSRYSKEEIRDRYGYMLPFYITRAMRELREYNHDVCIEIDLTEKERCIIGLMPLQEGKFFWMNNGGSAYNDYSALRTKSMRTVLNEYAGIIPVELFTQAVYPHQSRPYDAQRYNVNTTLIGGHGFWGNLQAMTSQQRLIAGSMVLKAKRVLPYISALPLKAEGEIGASPEIYSRVNERSCAGQVIAFSGSAMNYLYLVKAETDSCLAVLDHSYKTENGLIEIPFQFTKPDDTREAFIIPNQGTGFGVISSTGWLDDAGLALNDKKMIISAGAPSIIQVKLPDKCSGITVTGAEMAALGSQKRQGYLYYELKTSTPGTITITWK